MLLHGLMSLPLAWIGTRHYAALLESVVVTLVCMALRWPYDGATSIELRSSGVTLLVMLMLFGLQSYPRLVQQLSLEKRVHPPLVRTPGGCCSPKQARRFGN